MSYDGLPRNSWLSNIKTLSLDHYRLVYKFAESSIHVSQAVLVIAALLDQGSQNQTQPAVRVE